MTEAQLIATLNKLGVTPTDSMIPTTAMTKCAFNRDLRVRIVPTNLHRAFYTYLGQPEFTQTTYNTLKAQGLDDYEILQHVSNNYVSYLKHTKGKLYALQRMWTKLHRPLHGLKFSSIYEADMLRSFPVAPPPFIWKHLFDTTFDYSWFYTAADAKYNNGFWQSVDRVYHRERLRNFPHRVFPGGPNTRGILVPVNAEEARRLNPMPQTNKTLFKARRVTHIRRKVKALAPNELSKRSAEEILQTLMLPINI